jgi:3-hydroxyisobutyrate dehydrogenase
VAASPSALASGCDVLFASAPDAAALRNALVGAEGLAPALRRGTLIVDQGPGSPTSTRELARELSQRGLGLVDAPVHAETWSDERADGAILFGGADDHFAQLRPLLEKTCVTLVHCGPVGCGHAARLVTTTLAACNRLITCEVASVGFKQGLAANDMATVLNRSSGANSASERALPVLGSGSRTTDMGLAEAVRDLRLASRAAAEFGSPMLIGNLARSLFESAANQMGESAGLDDIARLYEAMAPSVSRPPESFDPGLNFSPPSRRRRG